MLEEYARHLLEGWHPVIVANRAPVEVHKEGNRFIATRGAGGLVSALSTLASSTDAVWVGGDRTPCNDLATCGVVGYLVRYSSKRLAASGCRSMYAVQAIRQCAIAAYFPLGNADTILW